MSTKEAVKHTPGPWQEIYDPEDGTLVQIAGPCREHRNCHKTVVFHAAHVSSSNDKFHHNPANCHCAANARLIAAAPEMLEALKEAIELIEPQIETISEFEAEWNNDSRRWLARVEAVIAKVERRS